MRDDKCPNPLFKLMAHSLWLLLHHNCADYQAAGRQERNGNMLSDNNLCNHGLYAPLGGKPRGGAKLLRRSHPKAEAPGTPEPPPDFKKCLLSCDFSCQNGSRGPSSACFFGCGGNIIAGVPTFAGMVVAFRQTAVPPPIALWLVGCVERAAGKRWVAHGVGTAAARCHASSRLVQRTITPSPCSTHPTICR